MPAKTLKFEQPWIACVKKLPPLGATVEVDGIGNGPIERAHLCRVYDSQGVQDVWYSEKTRKRLTGITRWRKCAS